MRTMRTIVGVMAMALVAAACGTTSSSPALDTIVITTTSQPATTLTTRAGTEGTGATTTTAAGVTELDLSVEPAGWADVTVTTEDGIDLYARHWPGNEVAVLVTHDFDNPTPGSAGQRAAQSSEVLLPYTAALARQGYTVLSPDFRGHGLSGGEYDVRASQLDLAALYAWLEAEGHDTIVLIGWAGSATAGVVLDAARDDIAFDGIAMLFSPPQDTGLDAGAVIGEIDAATLFIASNAGQSASWAKRLEAKAVNSLGVFVFERVPSGVTFFDLFGGELAGRIADFVASV